MKLKNIFETLNNYAPLNLSKEFVDMVNGYDNSGVIVETDEDIEKIVYALDLTNESVDKAIEVGAKLIITHHPAIYSSIKSLTYEDGALLKCIQNKIGVISMHLNLDVCSKGIDYYLANGLGAENQEILLNLGSNCGYGRVFKTHLTAKELKNRYMQTFNTDKAVLYGDENKKINTVASFCGSGLDVSELETAKNADIYVSSDIKHHVIVSALEKGKCVLDVSHYSSEFYGFNKFYNEIAKNLNGLEHILVNKLYML